MDEGCSFVMIICVPDTKVLTKAKKLYISICVRETVIPVKIKMKCSNKAGLPNSPSNAAPQSAHCRLSCPASALRVAVS